MLRKHDTMTIILTLKVKDGDTLVRIGAHFDITPSELIKLNRLVSRTVFTGQVRKLFIFSIFFNVNILIHFYGLLIY